MTARGSKAQIAPLRFYTPREACGILRCKLTHLYRLIHERGIECRKIGRSTIVHAGQIDQIILDAPIGLTVGIGRRSRATTATTAKATVKATTAKAPSKTSTKKVSK